MDKTFIITGSSRGIGKGAALSLAESGNIVLNYIKNKEMAEETAEKIREKGGKCETFKADVSIYEEAKALVDFAISTFGNVSALVNNAGIAPAPVPFDMTDYAQWKRVFDVNVFGAFNCTKAVLPYMISQKKGSIVNVSSVWGMTGGSCEAVYSSSKAALIGFTKAMAKELAPSGIRVNAVAPGIIETEMDNHLSEDEIEPIKAEIPLGKMGTIEDIGKIIAFLCEDRSSYITGEIIKADGGWI